MTSQQLTPPLTDRAGFFHSRIFLTLLIVAISLLALTEIADQYAHQQLNQSMLEAGVAFGSARLLDSVISMLESIEVSFGVGINIGAILSPLKDLIDKFCTVMTVAMGSLALQKILVTILSTKVANLIVCLSSSALLVTMWVKSATKYKNKALPVFKAVVLVRFLIIASVGLNLMVDAFFLSEMTQENSAQIERVTASIEDVSALQEKSAEESDDQSYLASMKEGFSKMTNAVAQQQAKIAAMKADIESSISSFINLMVLFLLKTVLLPLVFLMALKKLFEKGVNL